jgi:hypothetical protein
MKYLLLNALLSKITLPILYPNQAGDNDVTHDNCDGRCFPLLS